MFAALKHLCDMEVSRGNTTHTIKSGDECQVRNGEMFRDSMPKLFFVIKYV